MNTRRSFILNSSIFALSLPFLNLFGNERVEKKEEKNDFEKRLDDVVEKLMNTGFSVTSHSPREKMINTLAMNTRSWMNDEPDHDVIVFSEDKYHEVIKERFMFSDYKNNSLTTSIPGLKDVYQNPYKGLFTFLYCGKVPSDRMYIFPEIYLKDSSQNPQNRDCRCSVVFDK